VAVTEGAQVIETMDVTRDGARLVFDSDRSGNFDIYTMPARGGEAIQLTTDSTGDFAPAWAPDGRTIAFHSLRLGVREIYAMHAEGTGRAVRVAGAAHLLDANWSPAGDTLVFEVLTTTGRGNISFGFASPDEAPGFREVELDVPGDFPNWSPRGDLIGYHATDGIRVIPPAGGPSRLLTDNRADGAEAFYLDWAPDGHTLYYLARGQLGWQIRAASVSGGGSRVLVEFGDRGPQPTRYGFATDGRSFWLTLGSHESDVWVGDLGTR
jgi:Tol biopolymer transport system component